MLRRLSLETGGQIRDARHARKWGAAELAERSGVSRWLVYLAERGDPVSLEALARMGNALGLRLDVSLVDPRQRAQPHGRQADLVHAAMGEFEAAHFRPLGFRVALDEPYQHYQFAGRADFVAWDVDARALLHIENRTRFPDFQEMAGAFNAKRAYLGAVLAARLGINHWRSQTHVLVAVWTSEVLHSLRLHRESFHALAGDEPEPFAAWWSGHAPAPGNASVLVALDPLAHGRQRDWIGLEEALTSRPRHRGYADVARLLTRAA